MKSLECPLMMTLLIQIPKLKHQLGWGWVEGLALKLLQVLVEQFQVQVQDQQPLTQILMKMRIIRHDQQGLRWLQK